MNDADAAKSGKICTLPSELTGHRTPGLKVVDTGEFMKYKNTLELKTTTYGPIDAMAQVVRRVLLEKYAESHGITEANVAQYMAGNFDKFFYLQMNAVESEHN